MKSLLVSILITSNMILLSPAYAGREAVDANQQTQASSPTRDGQAQKQSYVENASITHHNLNINGKSIPYTAAAGFMPIKNDANKTIARIFFIAYTKETQQTDSQQPLTFAFNGGPGSSSIWLHMGALGPRRALLANDGTALPKTYQLVDNEYTWLDFTDIVFVDPVGTGYSRATDDIDAQQFYNMNEDVKLMGEFVRLYVTEHQRWLSPKYIAGESYGTTRAVALAGHMQNEHGMLINGLVLISAALNFETFSFDTGNDLAYVLIVPSYTAAAWYHGKLSGNLTESLTRARDWAINEYMPALAEGSSLNDSERDEIVEKLAHYTGLSKSYIEESRMRIPNYQFTTELLRDSSLIIGQLDSRVKAPYIPSNSEDAFYDPSLFIVEGPFVVAFNNYVRDELHFKTDIPYIFLSEKIDESWKWSEGQQGYVNVTDSLTQAVSANKYLQVFVASGYFDLTTPWLSQAYTFAHLGLNPDLQNHITHKFYESGHQLYTSTGALEKFTQDVSFFFQQK
jgi:carboxypeptidase C (cathepsin A)